MSIRRINSTGRKRIAREDARISVRPDSDGVLIVEAAITLNEYGLPENAQVFLEAYRQTTFMRFDYGTIAVLKPPPETSRRLSEFTTSDALLFRIKVTAAGDRPGVLLAEGDRIPLNDDEEQPEDRSPLLPPAPGELGQEVWRLDFSGTSGPLLLVNNRVGDWKAVAASPVFRSLVYPSAMRQVLWHIFKVEETRDTDDSSDWRCRWLQFASTMPGCGTPPFTSDEDSEWDEWITAAVESFSRQHQMLEHFKADFARTREAST